MSVLSIITVNLNNAIGLEKTFKSVASMEGIEFEYIVIDGGSTDSSLDILHRYQHIITRWVSEPDGGIYLAMNKGITYATGDYCLFLNAGDWLTSPTILTQFFEQKPNADIVAGNVYFFDTIENKIKWHIESPNVLTAKNLFYGTLPHQATLIKRTLFEQVGYYNLHFKIVSDWLFWLDALIEHKASYQHIPLTMTFFAMDGISCQPAGSSALAAERKRILLEKYSLFLSDYNLLNELEQYQLNWQSSQSFIVVNFLQRIGVIGFGEFIIRLKNWLVRQSRTMILV